MDPIVALCKRRGFIFPASEIYGGLNGFWDFGPLGVELKNNLRDAWWHDMVRNPPPGPDGRPVQIVGLDSAIIQNPAVWEASGHVSGFNDPMVDCTASKKRYRADQLLVCMVKNKGAWAFPENELDSIKRKLKKAGTSPEEGEIVPFLDLDDAGRKAVVGPDAAEAGTLTEPRQFNLMFKTHVGAASGEENLAYLRPETAQGIFLNFKNIVDTMRVKVPFGIAQVGKAFRNEVTPRNFIFRSREFEQMEMEFFCHPDEAAAWYDYWVQARLSWWTSLGIAEDGLQRRDHTEDELAHYSTACADVEYRYPFTAPGFGELEGIAHRGGFDLGQHQEHGQAVLAYFDAERDERYIPHVIEPASGLTRGLLVLVCEAFREEWVPKAGTDCAPRPVVPGEADPEGFEKRTLLRFSPRLAPVKVAVFPLLKNKPELVDRAEQIFQGLRSRWPVFYDQVGAIGRRYRRQDEIGTPYCVTVDFDTLEDHAVTVRDRDTMVQQRVPIDALEAWLDDALA